MFAIVGILLLVALGLTIVAVIPHPSLVPAHQILLTLAIVAIALALILQIFVLTSGSVWGHQ